LTENLFPFITPFPVPNRLNENKKMNKGIHLLVWPTDEHKKIYEMKPDDFSKSFKLVGQLEKIILNESKEYKSMNLIQNFGDDCGGSLSHIHFQANFLSFIHSSLKLDLEFEKKYNESFIYYMNKTNPLELTLRKKSSENYGNVKVMVPYFMKRPYDVVIGIKEKGHFNELSDDERLNFSRAIQDVVGALSIIMPEEYNKELSYNILFHSGDIDSLYAEILPRTQINGGFERSGTYICQHSPSSCAEIYTELINSNNFK